MSCSQLNGKYDGLDRAQLANAQKDTVYKCVQLKIIWNETKEYLRKMVHKGVEPHRENN